MSDVKLNADLIRELAALLEETGLGEIEYEVDDFKVRVARPQTAVREVVAAVPQAAGPVASMPTAPSAGKAEDHPGALKSPMVGTVYLTPDPNSPPFVKVGDSVQKGTTVAIIEAMKVMNPIQAHKSGKIVEVHVESGQPVEYGQPLLIIE